MNKYAIYFSRAIWLGILLDWLLWIPTIFFPHWMLRVFGYPDEAQDWKWVAFSALLTVLLSLFYIPGALNPYAQSASAWLAVIPRAAYALFFLVLHSMYWMLGVTNLVLFCVQLPLLILTKHSKPQPLVGDDAPAKVEQQALELEYDGSTFAEVRDAAFSGTYEKLPMHAGLGLTNVIQFFNASARNLVERRDIRPRFDKLIHANGICYTGVWKIDQPSPFTGYFAEGAQGLVIARISVAGNQVAPGYRRTLGIAGKIFPTLDEQKKVKPANFVTVDALSGSRDTYTINAQPTNRPKVGWDPAANVINRIIFRLIDSRPGYRQLFPISSLGVPPGQPLVTPDLMMLKVADHTPRIYAGDFREELRLKNYPGGRLVYTINVKSLASLSWTQLGTIEFTADAISEGGDKRLHFWIPQDFPCRN